MFKTETAETVFRRTYSRKKPNGEMETWPETVQRVVEGNLALVPERYIETGEREQLIDLIQNFRFLPAGRHLKSSGVNDFALNNCWAAGWIADKPEEHFTFTLLRLAEGGGVGSNYSSRYLHGFPAVENRVTVHIVCDPLHPDFEDLAQAGVISGEYDYEWAGAYSVEDSREGWADALGDLIRTAHDPSTKHENRVYDVSRVRAKGAPLRSFGGTASGPEPFTRMMTEVGKILTDAAGSPMTGMDAMAIDHQIAMAIVAGGVRRSARMSIMAWDDSMIEAFLKCKSSDQTTMWTTNISVEIDDSFIKALLNKDPRAQSVMSSLAEGALGSGEPGFWNSSLTSIGEVDGTFTTNPCGEATLTPWEPCNLGSVNLGEFVTGGEPDLEGLEAAHRLATRYLIRATFAKVSDPKSCEAIQKYRRIGLGHLGFADYLVKQGIKYSRAPYTHEVRFDLRHLAWIVDQAAAEYANELRIPVPVKKRVIAPTGTTSKLASASGEGIHAPFAGYFLRRIRFSNIEPTEAAQIEEYKKKGYCAEPCIYAANTTVVEIPTVDPLLAEHPDKAEFFEHAGELTLEQMLSVQKLYQDLWADQAVSYTASVDPEKYRLTDVFDVLACFLPALKGSTIFPEMSRDQAPYERLSEAAYLDAVAFLGETATDTGYDEICASGSCPI
ncbi:ribonucleoside-triphosphate reductase, adenosylcobalamin-dependent [Streptomyces noursei]|uniref:ribonucleoside-triphosphate reductase, adenosylcobalamin-dependent n=1 Tax=Streptomyces noursei TaxID=1971 RepID=UPI00199D8B87|nr:ribonucleoside-triphosphate reductase, adenosylcobalamin-dependent [Streptomyces noursei]MCZ1019431.1 ribonucleoside-triphosphate reductase, adenosylcobalamin-dependent [Streptomyces noursei]GGX08359.1 adenosylcobalamin-dependent ribonucleoside-triphosphate reductase [Streptomyces noursei]